MQESVQAVNLVNHAQVEPGLAQEESSTVSKRLRSLKPRAKRSGVHDETSGETCMISAASVSSVGQRAERYDPLTRRRSVNLGITTIYLAVACTCCDRHPLLQSDTNPAFAESVKGIQERIRSERHAAIMKGVKWALIHCAEQDEEKAHDVLSTLTAIEHGEFLQVRGLEGLTRFREQARDLLRSRDVIVRGFGALVLAVIGERSSVQSIADLLRGQPVGDAEDLSFVGWDRHIAAVALGILEAREYTGMLVDLLHSPNCWIRQGAAAGLGFMKAQDQAAAVAALLDDHEDEVKMAAINGLVLMNARDQSDRIAALIGHGAAGDVVRLACRGLAKLDAKTHAEDIVGLVRKGGPDGAHGDASEALALMGLKEYAADIARLLEDNNDSVCMKALNALKMLHAEDYARAMLACLKRGESVRSEAAKAIGELGDKTIAREVRDIWKTSEDRQVQIWAAYTVMKIENTDSGMESLIDALGDKDVRIRESAHEALKSLTGLDYDADYDKWQRWWKGRVASMPD